MTQADLLDFLFDTPGTAAEKTLADWIGRSRQFRAFVTENRVKIRKKLRLCQTSDDLQSLLLELDIARQLAEDTRCLVEYEADGQGERSPDFAVTFRTHTRFRVEVTRVRMAHPDAEKREEKLSRVVCSKLGQFVPQAINCLAVAAVGGSLTEDEASTAMKTLKRHMEQPGDRPAYIPGDSSSFYKKFRWLSAIVLCFVTPGADADTVIWTNAQAGRPLPPDIRTLLQAIALTPTDGTADV